MNELMIDWRELKPERGLTVMALVGWRHYWIFQNPPRIELQVLALLAMVFGWIAWPNAAAMAIETMPIQRFEPFKGTVIASDPSVVFDGKMYHMAYTELDWQTNRTVIAMAVSADGRNWTPVDSGDSIPGVVVRGREDTQDQNVEAPELVMTETGWLLYFSGYRDEGTPSKGFPASLWLASSTDGIHFTRLGNGPVMEPTVGWYDNDAIHSPAILRVNGTYVMAYAGHAYTNTSKISQGGTYILAAESADGIVWKKLDRPLLGPGAGPVWMNDGAAEPELVFDSKGKLHLLLTGLKGEDRVIGIADTPEWPEPFTVRPTAVVVPDASRDEVQVLAPTVVVKDGIARIWYLSYAKVASGLTFQIGQADLNELLLSQ